jgi:hypothetical protein
MLKAWKGVGLSNVHSKVCDPSISVSNFSVDVKKEGTDQWLLATVRPLAKRSYIINPNNTVATTDRIDPKLDRAFQAAKASG